jgi:hypothetical protein
MIHIASCFVAPYNVETKTGILFVVMPDSLLARPASRCQVAKQPIF